MNKSLFRQATLIQLQAWTYNMSQIQRLNVIEYGLSTQPRFDQRSNTNTRTTSKARTTQLVLL